MTSYAPGMAPNTGSTALGSRNNPMPSGLNNIQKAKALRQSMGANNDFGLGNSIRRATTPPVRPQPTMQPPNAGARIQRALGGVPPGLTPPQHSQPMPLPATQNMRANIPQLPSSSPLFSFLFGGQ